MKKTTSKSEVRMWEVFLDADRRDATLEAVHDAAGKTFALATALHQGKSANDLANLWDEVDSAHEYAREVLTLALETSAPPEARMRSPRGREHRIRALARECAQAAIEAVRPEDRTREILPDAPQDGDWAYLHEQMGEPTPGEAAIFQDMYRSEILAAVIFRDEFPDAR